MEHRILHLDNDLGIAVCGDVFVSMFNAAPTEERLDKLYELQRGAVTGKHPFITLIDPRAGRDFSPGARAKASSVAELTSVFTSVNVYVVLSQGFTGAAARSALAGILLLSRKTTPWKVVSTVDDGVAWLRELGHAVDAKGVAACAAALMQR